MVRTELGILSAELEASTRISLIVYDFINHKKPVPPRIGVFYSVKTVLKFIYCNKNQSFLNMKLFIVVTTILLILNTVNGCLRVYGSYNAGCVIGKGHVKLVDNGDTTCEGDCDNYRDCKLNCVSGYSARIEYGYKHLVYSNPQNTFTQDLKPDESYYCCIFNFNGGCNSFGFTTRLDGSFFGC